MADNVAITAGTGTTVHADEYTHSTLGSGKTQLVKLVDGTLDSSTAIEAGGGVEAGALRVTLASDSTGVVSIDDNGETLTVDGTVAVTNADIGTIAGAVAGTEMQVDVLTMPTVTVNAHAVTNAGTFAVQATEADGANVTLGSKVDAKSTATDTTPITVMQVLKQISASVQAPPSQAVTFTGSGDVATQTTLSAINAKMVTGTDIGDVTINNSTGAAAVNIQDGGNTITVDGTVAVTNSDITSSKTALELIDNSVDGNYLNTNLNYAGTDAATGNGTAAGSLRVSLASDSTGIVSLTTSTASIGKLAANSGVDIGDVTLTAGTAAIGTILPTDIDITAHANYARKYYTSAGAVTDGIIWSPAAGKRWHVTSLYFQTSADATITFEDDKAGGDDPVLKGEYKAGSGVALTFDERYPFASGEDAADLMVTTSAGNIYVSVVGYEI